MQWINKIAIVYSHFNCAICESVSIEKKTIFIKKKLFFRYKKIDEGEQERQQFFVKTLTSDIFVNCTVCQNTANKKNIIERPMVKFDI